MARRNSTRLNHVCDTKKISQVTLTQTPSRQHCDKKQATQQQIAQKSLFLSPYKCG